MNGQAGGNRILGLAALVSGLVFVALLANKALWTPLLSDDAFMASVAKNLAWGHGWATSYGQLRPFDPEITTGPPVLGVIALGIQWFGNATWVPRVFPLLLNLLLLGVLLLRLRRHLGTQATLWVAALLPLAFALVRPAAWITPLGELPAALFASLSALLAYEGQESGRIRPLLAAGLLAGLAVLTKTIAALPVLGILVAWAVLGLAPPAQRQRRAWLLGGVAFVAALLATVAPWQAYKAAVLATQPLEYRIFQQGVEHSHFLNTGSGIGGLQAAWAQDMLWHHLVHLARFNFQFYQGEFAAFPGSGPVVLSVLLLAVAALPLVAVWQRRQPVWRLLLLLLLPALVYLLWAVLLRQWLWARHLYVGLFMALVGLSVYVARKPPLAAALLLYLAFTAAIVSPSDGIWGERYRFMSLPNPGNKPLAEVLAVLESGYHDEKLVGCGYEIPREVEYALSTVNRIGDCHEELGRVLDMDVAGFVARYPAVFGGRTDISREEALRTYVRDKERLGGHDFFTPVTWHGSTSFIIVDYPLARLVDSYPQQVNFDAILAFCSERLFDNGLYGLYRCRQADLEKAVAARDGIGFVLPQWKLEVYRHAAARRAADSVGEAPGQPSEE